MEQWDKKTLIADDLPVVILHVVGVAEDAFGMKSKCLPALLLCIC